MSVDQAHFPSAISNNQIPSLSSLFFASARESLAQLLVVISFVWPFFNYYQFDPSNTAEINFLPVFAAALIVPEIALREKLALLLAIPVFAVALIWANPTAPLRLAIGMIPLHFVLNLTRHLRERGRELIPPNFAYRSRQVFVAFCMAQTVHFRLFPILPGWLIQLLTTIVPRYMEIPYDFTGIRGVQGWASEPSSAGLTCMAFALVAVYQRPDRRWRVLSIFVLFVLLNKSMYALILLTLLGMGCLFTLRRKNYSLLTIAPFILTVAYFAMQSRRFAELQTNLMIDGFSRESNKELMRLAQILYPLESFPRIYRPPDLYGGIVMEPMGLLPLVVGYGSVLGLAWLAYVLWRNFPRGLVPMPSLALAAGFVLLIMASPDLIPSVVALAVFLTPRAKTAAYANSGLVKERI